jgi:hypothetical protein
MQVYLIGPITGHSEDAIADWRRFLRDRCQAIDFVDPTLDGYDATSAFQQPQRPSRALERLAQGRLVIERNKLLIRGADLVVANFLGAKDRASIGGVGELFLAHAFAKPIIIVREKSGNVHDHAMLNALATRVCFSLEEACGAIDAFQGGRLHIA